MRIAWLVVALAPAIAACSSSTTAPATTEDAGTLTDAAGGDTWASFAADFFVRYCNSCHTPQDATGRDYSVQANVKKDMQPMRCGVASVQDPAWQCASSPCAKQFPFGPGPKPSDADRARLVAWINAGEP
jgi:hypothetical protein